jgi:hypothetical protein
VDFEKAFDKVNWITMMEVLKQLQVDWQDRRFIRDLYMKQQVVVRVADGESKPAVISRGVGNGARWRRCCFPYVLKE